MIADGGAKQADLLVLLNITLSLASPSRSSPSLCVSFLFLSLPTPCFCRLEATWMLLTGIAGLPFSVCAARFAWGASESPEGEALFESHRLVTDPKGPE